MTHKEIKQFLRATAADAFNAEWEKFVKEFKKELRLDFHSHILTVWFSDASEPVLEVRWKKEVLQDIADQDDFEVLEHNLEDYQEIVRAATKRIETLKKEFEKA